MQYTAIFHGCKNVNFQMKNYNIFLIFAQNIDCGYTLEPHLIEGHLIEGVLTSTHNLCFRAKIRNHSRTNGPINAHLTIAQVMPKYNHNNEKQEAFL